MKRLVLFFSTALLLAACSGGGPVDRAGDRVRGRPGAERDAGVAEAGTTVPPLVPVPTAPVQPAPLGARPRVLVKAEARALALHGANLIYGDTVEDGVFLVPKAGGEPKRIARRSPTSRTFAIDGEEIAWVASPGDAVLRASLQSSAFPTTLRDRGIFADVAANRGDVFVSEALGGGGALFRITGPTAARLTAFDGAPRGLLVDASHVFIVTATKILKTSHQKGDVETVASGTHVEWPALAGDRIFYVAQPEGAHRRALFVVPKSGGTPTLVARDVRDAPIAVEGTDVFWFDGSRPQLRAATIGDAQTPPRVVSEDPALATPSSIAVDTATVFVGTGSKEEGAVVAIARRP
ncbi:MAG: membrane lipoprotein lipid attachment site-containing protein [Deltaproteobacteria bacterium]|nr:membrane lipoprotein lipid attachment site-containing protein [Deltaproteobacteria bacterium]